MVGTSEEREGEREKEVTEELPFDKPNLGPIVNSPSSLCYLKILFFQIIRVPFICLGLNHIVDLSSFIPGP